MLSLKCPIVVRIMEPKDVPSYSPETEYVALHGKGTLHTQLS
jgi:hypothetical protein